MTSQAKERAVGICSKCTIAEKTSYHLWCKGCIAESQRRYARKMFIIRGHGRPGKEYARRRRERKDPRYLLNSRKSSALSRLKFPEKAKARMELTYALRRGDIIKPDLCSNCFRIGRIEGHHEDYSKPLQVDWLCVGCHRLVHKGQLKSESKRESK